MKGTKGQKKGKELGDKEEKKERGSSGQDHVLGKRLQIRGMARWESGVIAKEIKCNGGKFQRGRKGDKENKDETKDKKQMNKKGSEESTINGGV